MDLHKFHIQQEEFDEMMQSQIVITCLSHGLLVSAYVHPSQPRDKIPHHRLPKQLKQSPDGLPKLALLRNLVLSEQHGNRHVHDQVSEPLPHLHRHRAGNRILVGRPVVEGAFDGSSNVGPAMISEARALGRVASFLSFTVKHSWAVFASLTTTTCCAPSLILNIGPYLSAREAKISNVLHRKKRTTTKVQAIVDVDIAIVILLDSGERKSMA
nr:dynein assembly factor with WDR repeat domains 1 [Ipomoea batatas]